MDITDDQLQTLGVTRAVWDQMDPAEQEAIMEPEPESNKLELRQATDAPDDEGEEAPAAEAPAKAPAATEAATEAPAESPGPADDDEPLPTPPSPESVEAAKQDFAARRQEIDQRKTDLEAKLDDLDKKFEDGDLTTVEYNKARRSIDSDLMKVVKDETLLETDERRHADEVQRSTENARNQAVARWNSSQRAFFIDPDNAPIYGNKLIGHSAIAQLNAAIKENTERAKAEGWGFKRILAEAHAKVLAHFGDDLKPFLNAKPATPTQPKHRAPDLKAVPPTLGGVPAADLNQPAGEFAHIDSLEGEDYLAALEKMTAEQRDRYTAAR